MSSKVQINVSNSDALRNYDTHLGWMKRVPSISISGPQDRMNHSNIQKVVGAAGEYFIAQEKLGAAIKKMDEEKVGIPSFDVDLQKAVDRENAAVQTAFADLTRISNETGLTALV